MNTAEIKKLLLSSVNSDTDTVDAARRLEEEGISFDFSNGFRDKVLNNLVSSGLVVKHQMEFVKNMNFAFYRIALTGVAAIVVLLLSLIHI